MLCRMINYKILQNMLVFKRLGSRVFNDSFIFFLKYNATQNAIYTWEKYIRFEFFPVYM